MGIIFGDIEISNMFVGDAEVSSVYYGDTKAYENSIDEERQYLTFVPVSDATFTWTNKANSGSLYYSLNNGSTWTALGDGESTPIITSGNKILWKGDLVPSYDGIGTFSSDADYNASGNIMSLLYGDDFYANDKSIRVEYAFESLFNGDTHILTPPLLPAISLSRSCYTNMFYWCTNLITAPELPATTLASDCYSSMFQGCTSLTTAPDLPATTLTDYCYSYMFEGCTSLTTAPALPATTLETSCYRYMFQGCTRLIRAPELPATTLESNCYRNMFYGCTLLNYIKCLATNISASNSLTAWVTSVPFKGAFVKAADMKSWRRGPDGIPPGWTVVDA